MQALDRDWLAVSPTALEAGPLRAGLGGALELVGLGVVGPVATAAAAAQLIAERRPPGVLLLGCAGTFDEEQAPLGRAFAASVLFSDGVGVGADCGHAGMHPLGLPQWAGDEAHGPVIDRIECPHAPQGAVPVLTVCAASASPAEAALRRARHPEAILEEMEGFALALAATLAHLPFGVVRGISNRAGDRDHGGWRLEQALSAAAALARELVQGGSRA